MKKEGEKEKEEEVKKEMKMRMMMWADWREIASVPCMCTLQIFFYPTGTISRVSDQNGVSPLYIILEIHHSCMEPSVCSCYCQP